MMTNVDATPPKKFKIEWAEYNQVGVVWDAFRFYNKGRGMFYFGAFKQSYYVNLS